MVSSISTNDLMNMLAMEEVAVLDDRSRTYRAPDQPVPADRVFGGLQLAQAVMAATRDAPATLRPLALSADFLAGVPTTGSNTWLVEEIGASKAMSSRRATLLGDDGAALFTATVRLGDVRDDLPSYGTVRARDVTPPEDLPTLSERFSADDRVPSWWSMRRPVDFRHVETPAYTEPVVPPQAHQSVWWRPDGEIPADPATIAAMLAYASDMSVVEPVFRQMGSARHRGSSRILSLTHNLVFHAIRPLTGWVQMDCHVPTLAHGRALGTAEMHTREGQHLATVSQLALVKLD